MSSDWFHTLMCTLAHALKLTWGTWSCTRRAGSTSCSPSGPGPSHRSCHRCGRSWHFRSWWRPCPGSAIRWGRTHRTAPCAPLPWGWVHGHTLDTHTNTHTVTSCPDNYLSFPTNEWKTRQTRGAGFNLCAVDCTGMLYKNNHVELNSVCSPVIYT